MSTKTSQLINDLSQVPNIIGSLGLSIAAAQKAFNLDYMDNVERLIVMTQRLLSEQKQNDTNTEEMEEEEKEKLKEFSGLLKDLLNVMAPSRYQFTETTLTVRLDLSQTLDTSGSIGLGVGYGGIALNAGMTRRMVLIIGRRPSAKR